MIHLNISLEDNLKLQNLISVEDEAFQKLCDTGQGVRVYEAAGNARYEFEAQFKAQTSNAAEVTLA